MPTLKTESTLPLARIRNEQGQMAIFVAMIFQVLFVLFAMSINVALVVHDKINLQNAVDLAAYYGAQKQAEILNAIAHQNYQIRQAWKLLAWRYRVLGTMGLSSGSGLHPTRVPGVQGDDSQVFWEIPELCVSYRDVWIDGAAGNTENLCQKRQVNIPAIPFVPIRAPFNGFNAALSQISQSLRNSYKTSCEFHGARNWEFAATILHAFRLDQANRREVLYALARNLTARNQLVDIQGEPVSKGVENTLKKNLTHGNATGGLEFEFYNSLQGVAEERVFPKIVVYPEIAYMDISPTAADQCNTVTNFIPNGNAQSGAGGLPMRGSARNLVLNRAGQLNDATRMWYPPENPYALVTGVEKNPWVMAYVGVKATTRPRQLFFPIGDGVTLTARAFAKPFGGRIGPWYGSTWAPGAPASSGAPIDSLLPPRFIPGVTSDYSTTNPARFPNYSKYPGDVVGLSSVLAQDGLFYQTGIMGGTSLDFFVNIQDPGPASKFGNDFLAWSPQSGWPAVRDYEIAAIAPDLFDITYYSIEPDYTGNYYNYFIDPKVSANLFVEPRVPQFFVRPDLGSRDDVMTMNVRMQMERARAIGANTNVAKQSLQRDEAFYFAQDISHLLTGWVPNDEFGEYVQFPEHRFGKCDPTMRDVQPSTPGMCPQAGGRVGYSVKLVSREFFDVDQNLGNSVAAKILNPPPKGW